MRAKLRESAVWPLGAGCYFWAAMHSNHSKTLYMTSAKFSDFFTPPWSLSHSCNLRYLCLLFHDPLPPLECGRHKWKLPYLASAELPPSLCLSARYVCSVLTMVVALSRGRLRSRSLPFAHCAVRARARARAVSELDRWLNYEAASVPGTAWYAHAPHVHAHTILP